MKEKNRTIITVHIAIYMAVLIEFISLALNQMPHLWMWGIGFCCYVLLLPMGKGTSAWKPPVLFLLLLVNGVLTTLGVHFAGSSGSLEFLYFIIITFSARLPRRYSLMLYLCILTMVFFPSILVDDGSGDWKRIVELIPGMGIFIFFSEFFWHFRRVLEEKQKLLDTLIDTQRQLNPHSDSSKDPVKLTRRDREVLELIAFGYSNKEIAQRLNLAEGTVKNRVSSILAKMGLRDRTQAALRARDLGIL